MKQDSVGHTQAQYPCKEALLVNEVHSRRYDKLGSLIVFHVQGMESWGRFDELHSKTTFVSLMLTMRNRNALLHCKKRDLSNKPET